MPMFNNKITFSRLPTNENDQALDADIRTSPKTKSRRKFYRFGFGAIVLFALLAVVSSSTSLFSETPKWSSCGDSVATARARGCSFDLISFAWQTPECYDAELVNDFATWEGNWTFYADDKFTVPVGQDLAIQGDLTPLFVKWDYHMVHCTFMWRQMHRAYEKGYLDSHLRNYNHTMHCQMMMLMDPETAAKKVTVAQIIYPECMRARPGQKHVFSSHYT
ncbi:hypothetical protein F4777DRAFT_569361 [Nemania sp. FL0916]|nr:hypothetical protein F4777DRAFT_569361 [Nemania sp. FL0916]